MTLSKIELQALAIEMIAALPPEPPVETTLLLTTGETFSPEALEVARRYDAATNGQRSALDEIARAFATSSSPSSKTLSPSS